MSFLRMAERRAQGPVMDTLCLATARSKRETAAEWPSAAASDRGDWPLHVGFVSAAVIATVDGADSRRFSISESPSSAAAWIAVNPYLPATEYRYECLNQCNRPQRYRLDRTFEHAGVSNRSRAPITD